MAEIRTFIAIAIDPAITAQLTAFQEVLRGSGAAVGWTRSEGMHITLKFLGNIAEERVPLLADALHDIAKRHQAFHLEVAGAGGFPNLRRPRVIWAGLHAGAAQVAELAQEVEDVLSGFGFPREERPFHPHLTLGRVKSPAGTDRLATLLTAHQQDVFGVIMVADILLIRSELTPHGPHYTELSRAPLQACIE